MSERKVWAVKRRGAPYAKFYVLAGSAEDAASYGWLVALHNNHELASLPSDIEYVECVNTVWDYERNADAARADASQWCVCGDHDSDHYEGIFVKRRPDDAPGRACAIPFCRCANFSPMTKWAPWGTVDEP